MPFNGAGSYSPPGADFPAISGTLILSTKFNNVINDIATALSTCITKDGQTTVTANLPMAGFRHTGAGNAVLRGDYATYGQLQDGSVTWFGGATGTADNFVLTPVPAITAYTVGQRFRFFNNTGTSNTGQVTVNISGLGPVNVRQRGTLLTAVQAIGASATRLWEIIYTNNAVFEINELQMGVPLDALTAKGTIMAAQGNMRAFGVAVGTDGQILLADSTATPGIKWNNQALKTTAQTLTDGANIDWNMSLGGQGTETLGGNRIQNAPTNLRAGEISVLTVIQDGTGGRSLTWNAVFKGKAGCAMPQPNPVASSTTVFLFTSDGTSLFLQSITLQPTKQIYSATGANTWTKPAGLLYVDVEVLSAGGGGQGSAAGSGITGQPGGAGAYGKKRILSSALGTTETATVGVGGGGGSLAGPTNGAQGGTTSFGAHVSVTGGKGSATSDGGVSSSADVNGVGAPGIRGTGIGGSTIYGGGGLPAIPGQVGQGRGAGGGGGQDAGAGGDGGAGAPGLIVVWEHYA